MSIHIRHGPWLSLSFASASELRDALLASFKDASYAGGPLVMMRYDHAEPAWLWVPGLLRSRTDWHACVGVALQHAVAQGDALALAAFCDLMANARVSNLLLPWAAPVAAAWPDARATLSRMGFGGCNRPRLADVLADHVKALDHLVLDPKVPLEARGMRFRYADLRDRDDLRALLDRTAAQGRFLSHESSDGPWGWVLEPYLFRPWVRAAFPEEAERVAMADRSGLWALLDWLSEAHDLWRFADLLEGWQQQPPEWWDAPLTPKPGRWRRRMRPARSKDARTLGDVVTRLLQVGRAQRATPPRLDLQPCFEEP